MAVGKCEHCYKILDTRLLNYNTHHCKHCGRCRTICHCRGRAGAMYVPSSHAAAIGSSSMYIKSRRAIGLELELSEFGSWRVRRDEDGRLGKPPWTYPYTVTHDGSVQPSGLEAVFNPMYGDQMILNGLNTIAEHVYTNDCKVNNTCGFHVHVNAQDWDWYDIQKMLTLWLKLERGTKLYSLCGRMPNTHCQTWTKWMAERGMTTLDPNISKFKRDVLCLLYNVDTDRIPLEFGAADKSRDYKHRMQYHKEHPRDYPLPRRQDFVPTLTELKRITHNRGWNRAVASRYLNLNIHSWKYRGTLEYRLGAGTVDPTDIRMWPLFCLWLTEAVTLTSIGIIRDMINSRIDPINRMVEQGGMYIPSIKGPTVYPMPGFLQTWITNK